MEEVKRVLIAPLNWGLGHATRCIPLIERYLDEGWQVDLASDGDALMMLRGEFPDLTTHELPGYQVSYPRRSGAMLLTMLSQLPRINSRIALEKKWLEVFLKQEKIDFVISDNRYGLCNEKVRSVILCHQLSISSPLLAKTLNRQHVRMLNRFDECWLPDDELHSLSGDLSRVELGIPVKFIGPLSRFKKRETSGPSIPVLAVLSGPEPQRTILEKELIPILEDIPGAILIRGLMGDTDRQRRAEMEILGHLLSSELEGHLNRAELVICRSGYSSIMDLVALEKKAILIPTPGQPEQEYLADHMSNTSRFIVLEQSKILMSLPALISSISKREVT